MTPEDPNAVLTCTITEDLENLWLKNISGLIVRG